MLNEGTFQWPASLVSAETFSDRRQPGSSCSGLIQFDGTFIPNPSATLFAKSFVDLSKQKQHPFSDRRRLYFAQLKTQGIDDVVLLRFGLAVKEKRRLAKVIEEARAARANLSGIDPLRVAGKPTHVCAA